MIVKPFAATSTRWLDFVLFAAYSALGLTPLLQVEPAHHAALVFRYIVGLKRRGSV
jgi:hypothetical protein